MYTKTFLFLSLLTLCSMHSKMGIPKKQLPTKHEMNTSTALLEYIGTLEGTSNFNIGAQVEVDSTIGIRYDVTFQKGSSVLSHIAIFYKFSAPYQTIYYNFLTHKSMLNKGGGPGKAPNVTVIGTETIDTFSCTHLHQTGNHETQDYWMSTTIPGFVQVAQVLNKIDPNLVMIVINQSIFNWGGLVRLIMSSTTSTGQTTTMTLNLVDAKAGLTFPASDFDPPSK